MMLTRSSEPTAIADTIGPIFTTIAEAGDRQTVSRIGERERLDAEIRLLVLIRDGFTCAWCESRIPHASGRALQVDHILPWSAGGSDSTTNLRTLCRTHNQQRSNFRTDLDYARPRMACVRYCFPCLGYTADGEDRDEWDETEMVQVFCGCCASVSWTIPGVHPSLSDPV